MLLDVLWWLALGGAIVGPLVGMGAVIVAEDCRRPHHVWTGVMVIYGALGLAFLLGRCF